MPTPGQKYMIRSAPGFAVARWLHDPGLVGIPGTTIVLASTACGMCILIVDGQPGTAIQTQNCTFHENASSVARGACCPVLNKWAITSELSKQGTIAEGIHELTRPLGWF